MLSALYFGFPYREEKLKITVQNSKNFLYISGVWHGVPTPYIVIECMTKTTLYK